jgi:hypothetical protein
MKKHKWQKLTPYRQFPNISKCQNCDIYRIVYKTIDNNYITFYSYELFKYKIDHNGSKQILIDNATKKAPDCLTTDILNLLTQ